MFCPLNYVTPAIKILIRKHRKLLQRGQMERAEHLVKKIGRKIAQVKPEISGISLAVFPIWGPESGSTTGKLAKTSKPHYVTSCTLHLSGISMPDSMVALASGNIVRGSPTTEFQNGG